MAPESRSSTPERLRRIEDELSELHSSLQNLRVLVLATLAVVLVPLIFSIPPLSWLKSAFTGTLKLIFALLLLGLVGAGAYWLYTSLRRRGSWRDL